MKLIFPSLLFTYCLTHRATSVLAEDGGGPICHPTELNAYDYIVVGGGTAGSAAAAELARSLPDASVLLLDQGQDHSDERIVMDNDQFANAIQSPHCEHHFSTENALGAQFGPSTDRNIYTCVSKILGGASSLNYGGWYRAAESDLSEWASLSGDDTWSYDNMLPYFQRLEHVQRDEGSQPNPDRGYDGIIPVRHDNISILHYHTGLLKAIEDDLGVPVNDQDTNRRDQNAVGSLQLSRVENGCWYDEDGKELGCANEMRNGSAYNAFIRNPKRNDELPNLHILEGAKVVQIKDVTSDNQDGPMVVEYVKKSYRYKIEAREEILLSAGSWANPKIALLSGIGSATELEQVGIASQIDLPGVGRHLMDHGVLWMTAMLNDIQMADMSDNSTEPGFDLASFVGVNNPLPSLMAGANTINCFFKSNSALDHPDMELMTGLSPAGFNSAMMLLRLYQNVGTSGVEGGTLKLRSDDPSEEMDTTRNWYADDESIMPMLASLKTVLAMVQGSLSPSIRAMILSPNAFTTDFKDDEALKSYIRENVVSEMHLHGTMKMGSDQDPMAVVDGELKLMGSNGRVRVADTSIFPSEFRGHPMAAAMAVGMKAAAMMANDHKGATSGTVDATNGESQNGEGMSSEVGTDDVGLKDPSSAANGRDCAFVVAATACAFATMGA